MTHSRGSAYENINVQSVTENITMDVPQNISIYTFSVALVYNGNPFIIFLNIEKNKFTKTSFLKVETLVKIWIC